MKKLIPLVAGALWILATHAGAAIIAGPITNPANGHEYYLLSPDSWTASETEAEHLGGTLAIIKSPGEQEWVYSNFANFGGTNRNLWIGLYRENSSRSLVWVTGWKGDYMNWAGGQPDDAGRVEGYVFLSATHPWGFATGTWADCANEAIFSGSVPNGVVEVPGKSKEKALSGAERGLRGAWYAAGKADCPCYITSTDHALFIINESNSAGRIILTPQKRVFVAAWRISGEILQDKILWSNGTWWSRHPVPNDATADFIRAEDLKKAAGRQIEVPEVW
ncbi:MAG TPA: lectin-like protein [Verrucomicrobiae bacterium]|nr:lectin-like protein [Verrucomicrobiae bacterium]